MHQIWIFHWQELKLEAKPLCYWWIEFSLLYSHMNKGLNSLFVEFPIHKCQLYYFKAEVWTAQKIWKLGRWPLRSNGCFKEKNERHSEIGPKLVSVNMNLSRLLALKFSKGLKSSLNLKWSKIKKNHCPIILLEYLKPKSIFSSSIVIDFFEWVLDDIQRQHWYPMSSNGSHIVFVLW